MKKILVLTSGGDAPGMNACIRSVVRIARAKGLEVVGAMRGYRGLIDGVFVELKNETVGNILHTGGTMLLTSRCDEFLTKAGQEKALGNLKRLGIDGVIVIGGNGSFAGAQVLEKAGMLVACVPGTIDNDLYYTNYTLGFDTAVNTITGLINNIRDTAQSHERPSVVEVMGAECGDIALAVGAACGAEMILVPEMKTEFSDVCRGVSCCAARGKNSCLIITNERAFSADELSARLNKELGVSSRPLVVGHIQRGGSPSARDRVLALNFGARAVELLLSNNSGAIGVVGGEYIVCPIKNALNGKRKFNKEEYKLASLIGGNVMAKK